MSISSISSALLTPLTQAAAAPPPPPRTDNDGDTDNGAPPAKASTPPGVGTKVDITA
jgi:hypothetical protein